MLSITNLLRIALATYTLLQTLNTFPLKKCVRMERKWERVTLLYVLLVVGYCDPVVAMLLSAIMILHLCEKETQTLMIEKLTAKPRSVPQPPSKLDPQVARPPPRAPPSNPTDESFLITEDMLARTQTNHVGHTTTFPNETNSPGVNIQGIFDDLTGVQY